MRYSGWFEVFFEEVVFVGFVWLFLIWEAVLGCYTPLTPFERGGLDGIFGGVFF